MDFFGETFSFFRHTPHAVYGGFCFTEGDPVESVMKEEFHRTEKGTARGSKPHAGICLPSEIVYVLAVVLLAFAVTILTAADFGISMIVAPAYLLSRKLGVITFGQAEYILQAGVFLLLCLVLRKFRPVYLMSFVTCLIYGAVLDLWRRIPCFDPSVTPPGSMALWLRIPMFLLGVLLTSFSVALFFKTYLYPQVYDFFVKAVSLRYGIRLPLLKTVVDLTLLSVSAVMTFCFFGRLTGLGWGTLVMALLNGSIIGFFSKWLDRVFTFRPWFPTFAARFALDGEEK